MNSCSHCKSLKAKAWQTWTDCCEIARTIPHSILGMEHCCGMSHLARSNPHQHGSYYPHHSLECAGITAPPPAPPLWQHTHTHQRALQCGYLYPGLCFPLGRLCLCLFPTSRSSLGKMEVWVQSPHRQLPAVPALVMEHWRGKSSTTLVQ